LLVGLALAVAATNAEARGSFDAKGRLLIHGTPRFVLGVYDSGGGYAPNHAHWETQIFAPTGPRGLQGFPLNVYLNYHLGAMPIDSTNALLDVLDDHGMTYLQTGNCFDTGSWTRFGPGSFSIMSQAYVQQYALHHAALGYYIMDECVDALIPETEAHHQQLKAWDPQGITFEVNLAAGYRDPSLWVDAADVQATDPYPLYGPEPAQGYTHFIVADFVSKLRAVARPDRPVWSVLQFFQFTSDSRMPTPDELRTHAVMAIVEGAHGIFWWDIGVNGLRKQNPPTVAAYMNHLRTLTTELAGLEAALVADPAPWALTGNSTRFADPIAGRMAQLEHNIDVEWLFSRIQWYQEELDALAVGDTSKSGGMLDGAAHVRTLTKIVNGVGYVFAYNYTNSARPVTFTWHSRPTSVKESKTGQTFALNGPSWSDTIGPYGARIYIVGDATARDLGEFHGDGKGDILWRNSGGTLTQWRLDGTQVVSTALLGSVGAAWTVVGIGDFNGDGKADLLWRHAGGAVHVWLLNGASVITAASLGTLGPEWRIVAVRDFNGDGRADILWRHASGGLFVWLLNGTAVTGTVSLGVVATDWIIVALGDFNGDGRADILWRHASGAVFVWLLNGTGVIATASLGAVTSDWNVVGVGDINGGGKSDILWRHTSGTLHAWLLNGTTVTGSGALGTAPPDWTIAGVGDVNADGKADILWRHAGGTVTAWLLNGLSVAGTGTVGVVATSWQIQ
jgi:hypothetical protein